MPDGCFVELDGRAYLVRERGLLLWTPEGYAKRETKPGDLMMRVLTPELFCMDIGRRFTIQ